MNRRLLISLGIIGVVATIAIGGTVAYFSDTETSTGNTFTAGTLDLTVNNENPWTSTIFTVSDVKPGDNGSTTINLKNIGSIPKPGGSPWESKVFITITEVLDDDMSCPEPEGDVDDSCGSEKDGEIDDNLKIRVRDYWSSGGSLRFDETHTLSEWYSISKTFLKDDMPAGDENIVIIDWSVDSAVGNIIQSDKAEFNVTFTLEQTEPWP